MEGGNFRKMGLGGDLFLLRVVGRGDGLELYFLIERKLLYYDGVMSSQDLVLTAPPPYSWRIVLLSL